MKQDLAQLGNDQIAIMLRDAAKEVNRGGLVVKAKAENDCVRVIGCDNLNRYVEMSSALRPYAVGEMKLVFTVKVDDAPEVSKEIESLHQPINVSDLLVKEIKDVFTCEDLI